MKSPESLIRSFATWLLIIAFLAWFAWVALNHNIWTECWKDGGTTTQGMAKGIVCQKAR